MKHYKVNLFIILSCLSSLDTLEPDFTLDECTPEEYYAPYIKYKKTRAGDTVEGRYETGFLYLKDRSGIVCINGPYVFLFYFKNLSQTSF